MIKSCARLRFMFLSCVSMLVNQRYDSSFLYEYKLIAHGADSEVEDTVSPLSSSFELTYTLLRWLAGLDSDTIVLV